MSFDIPPAMYLGTGLKYAMQPPEMDHAERALYYSQAPRLCALGAPTCGFCVDNHSCLTGRLEG